MSCQSGYKFPADGLGYPDFDDVFVRKEYFSEGGLWGWGSGVCGVLGNHSVINVSSPVQTVSGGTNWKQSSIGLCHTAAIKSDGTLWLWGDSAAGQVGDNASIRRSSPVQTVSGGTNWKKVSLGVDFSAAIKTDGTLWLWGEGRVASGIPLGTNVSQARSSPVQTISGGTNWKDVCAGFCNVAAIKTDGTLWTWGLNTNGALGDNTVIARSSPVQTISGGTNWKQASVGYDHSAAIKTDGTLWLWGLNPDGRLGDGSTITRSSPVQTVSAGTNWKQVSVGDRHSAAIKTDGSLWLWGDNDGGELGANDRTTTRSSPIQTVSGGNNWKYVKSSSLTTRAIKTDGTLWVWGSGNFGTLGDNTTVSRSSPVQTVSGGTNWKDVDSYNVTTIAIREDCW